jgi:hypothetical protein
VRPFAQVVGDPSGPVGDGALVAHGLLHIDLVIVGSEET